MEILMTIGIILAYLAIGFVVSVLFRAYDKDPSKDDNGVYTVVMVMWPVALIMASFVGLIGNMGKAIKAGAERIKPGSTEVKDKKD